MAEDTIIIRPQRQQKVVIKDSIAYTDAELEALKEEYRQKIAEAEAAKAAYESAKAALDGIAEDLDDVAQETTSQQILSKMARQGSNANATNTEIYLEILGNTDYLYDQMNDLAAGIANSLTTLPYSLVFEDATYEFRGFELVNGRLWTKWETAGDDLYTYPYERVEALTRVYRNVNVTHPESVGQVTSVSRVTLKDIYDRIGNIDFSTLAKQGSNAEATNTAILEAVQNIDFTPVIDDYAEQLRTIIGSADSQVSEVA